MNILELPPELLSRTLSFLSFDEISSCRIVCKAFENTCVKLLNSGFQRVERYHGRILQQVKGQLPRRESERRNHPLSRHSDILTAVETRLSLLNMTFNKFIDLDLCCFIPGKVLDELYAVLRRVTTCLTSNLEPERPHELLQELRDISSMAMEHFDEVLAPRLREGATSASSARCASSFANLALIGCALQHPDALKSQVGSDMRNFTPPVVAKSVVDVGASSAPAAGSSRNVVNASGRYHVLTGEITKLQKQWKEQGKVLAVYKKELLALKATNSRFSKKMQEQAKVIGEQNRKFEEFSRKCDVMFAELGTRISNVGVGENVAGDSSSLAGNRKGKKRKARTPKDDEEGSEPGGKKGRLTTAGSRKMTLRSRK